MGPPHRKIYKANEAKAQSHLQGSHMIKKIIDIETSVPICITSQLAGLQFTERIWYGNQENPLTIAFR